jgi:hypothetical protein
MSAPLANPTMLSEWEQRMRAIYSDTKDFYKVSYLHRATVRG